MRGHEKKYLDMVVKNARAGRVEDSLLGFVLAVDQLAAVVKARGLIKNPEEFDAALVYFAGRCKEQGLSKLVKVAEHKRFLLLSLVKDKAALEALSREVVRKEKQANRAILRGVMKGEVID